MSVSSIGSTCHTYRNKCGREEDDGNYSDSLHDGAVSSGLRRYHQRLLGHLFRFFCNLSHDLVVSRTLLGQLIGAYSQLFGCSSNAKIDSSIDFSNDVEDLC
jgi:hypothetical protein